VIGRHLRAAILWLEAVGAGWGRSGAVGYTQNLHSAFLGVPGMGSGAKDPETNLLTLPLTIACDLGFKNRHGDQNA